jgi:hypothetical protein
MVENNEVRLRCSSCRTTFAPPDVISEELLATTPESAGIVECPHCHRFVQVGKSTLGHALPDGSWRHI